MIVLNSQMSEFLLSRGNTPIPETLELKMLEGFYEHADTIVFAFYKDRLDHWDYDAVISRYGDLTGFEASTNRIHIDDYIHNENFTTNEIINIGFSLVQLVQNLWNKLRDDECSIILSSDLESDFGNNASLTFHKKRANEILMDSLDGCLQAVFICDNNDSITI
ncbi:hypothetical protein EAH57_03295 [Acinetobacter sp. 2JN-4]|uniref:hypothetical protein n=1 Tax=Acinetobacter sp. 2JN-4 TaxID=2479844 RepID=UPI000EF9AA56|nr:hypothetical protein [Acinetobacter sp. 2JN-4]RLZ10031.1 hypothetical protein EAH57_03295 [Acinetobacter sp. 2JN-4]